MQNVFGNDISIRAPTRGATVKPWVDGWSDTFQSALPRGEQRSWLTNWVILLNFNPRSHEGSDTIYRLSGCLLVISIRAPTRGATVAYELRDSMTRISIRAPTRGATLWQQEQTLLLPFQSALPRGERRRCANK